MALSKKHQVFVNEYLKDLNATAAYKRAGYEAKGNAAEVNAARLLRHAQVAKAVQAAMDTRSKRTEITADKVLQEIAKLGFSDIRRVFNESGQLIPVHMLPADVAASISSIEVVTTRVPGSDPVEVEHTSKIKFWDKRGSLELLGKHLKLFTDKVEISGRLSFREWLEEQKASKSA